MCEEYFPATNEFFYKQNAASGKLHAYCKQCSNKRAKQWRKNNPERFRETQRNQQRHYRSNPDNHAKEMRYKAEYRKRNREAINQKTKEYSQSHPDKVHINNHNRRARKRGLPNTFTLQDWIKCLEHFHYCCAVCGKQLRDLLGDVEPNKDHWIPLSSKLCTGTIAKNMVCLCNVCNLSKHTKLPEQWLIEKYGKYKAKQILARIEAYFAQLE